MKKFFYFAASALMLMACAKTEELSVNKENAKNDGIKFEVYTQKALTTRGGGQVGDLNTGNIGGNGFGVFAYYTAGEKYDANAKPNFMYNQQVKKDGEVWKYEPVKYWPNEFGNAAISDEIDYVTFFAYAPYTPIDPTTGEIIPREGMVKEKEQKANIISVNKNTATGDPIIKYVVDTDPKTSVDLLWGVAAQNAAATYAPINSAVNPVEPGMPFIDLVKPADPRTDKVSFNLKHSLAKVKFTIDYIADEFTPKGATKVIDSLTTRIFVRSFTIGGWATKGALNLHNTKAGEPLWKDYDGVKDLNFNDVTFHDGRKDGKEGDVNGAQTNEENQGLNPNLIENYAQLKDGKFTGKETNVAESGNPTKNIGVAKYPQLLFGGDETENNGYFYVIPRNETNSVDVTIVYDVETIDKNLAGLLSDGESHGSSIENVITKKAILGQNIDFQAGKQYLIKIHIGMTSVKIDAVVTDWKLTNDAEVDLPDNQPMPWYTVEGMDRVFYTNPVKDGVVVDAEVLYNEATWSASAFNGAYKKYYQYADSHSMPYADRFNAQLNKTAIEYYGRESDKSAETMQNEGFIRCWAGALKDAKNGYATDRGSTWPVVAWDYADWAVAPKEIVIKYEGKVDFVHVVGEGTYKNKLEGSMGSITLAEAFNSDEFFGADGVASAFDPSKLEVRFYYGAAKKHTLYETVDAPAE